MTSVEASVWFVAFLVVTAILGLLIGSFVNVVAYRVPAGKSIVSPPSACPHCGAQIRPYDNIPVLSWFILRGKCRDCGAPISPRYPIVEAGTGMLFLAVGLWLWPSISAPIVAGAAAHIIVAAVLEVVAFLYLAAISVALLLIDLDTHKLPNKIVLPAYLVGVVLLGTSGVLATDYPAMLTAAIGAAAGFALYLLLAIVRPGGMGFGDVKLAGVLGLFLGWIGWGALVVGVFAAFLLGGVFGILLMAIRRAGRKTAIPFGPWMLVGAWIGIFFGRAIAAGYLALFGLD